MSELFGLYDKQHGAVGQLLAKDRLQVRPSFGVDAGDRTYQPPVRVIAKTLRSYNPLASELLPVFRYDAGRTVVNVVQVGTSLSGYLACTIGTARFVLECRRSSLADVQAAVPGMRATVFPGLWEFDFGELSEPRAAAVSVAVESITSEENTTLCQLLDVEDSVFTGSLIVRDEAWVSSEDPRTDETPNVVHRYVTDCIPYPLGAVKPGAIGLGIWTWDAGYLVNAWECRNFSHADGYVQSEDPAIGAV